MNTHYNVIIIGAGAAGLFCALNAGETQRVLVLDHANKVGKKILMSGGGRCNFTNLNTSHEDFTSQNPHFCKSALNQYSAYTFLSLVEKHNIEYVEKSPGQLFCKHSSKDILKMLLDECADHSVKIYKKCDINSINKNDVFTVDTSIGKYTSDSLVVATGGLSIPTLGATGFGYELAKQFGHEVVPTRASLVPFTLDEKILDKLQSLSGVSLKVSLGYCESGGSKYDIVDDMLFTHRGISGPAVLKLSAYWKKGNKIEINLLPDENLSDYIKRELLKHPDQYVVTSLSQILPKRLASYLCDDSYKEKRLKHLDSKMIESLSVKVHHWKILPSGDEGYKTAEVTNGGVSTQEISSKTMESKLVQNLYFIGEVVDVTGQLGGYNFQWAWSSAWCAAEHIRKC